MAQADCFLHSGVLEPLRQLDPQLGFNSSRQPELPTGRLIAQAPVQRGLH